VKSLLKPIKDYTNWLHTRWPAGTVEKFPEINYDGTTNVHGIRITGDLTGIPLLKFAVDSGVRAVREIMNEPDFKNRSETGKDALDLAVIGGGISGIAAAVEAKKAGLNFKVFEARRPFSTIMDFPKAKPIHTYPTDMIPEGDFQVSAHVKEALVEEMEQQRRQHDIHVVLARIDHLERRGNLIILHHGDSQTLARRVILAIGRSGNYRKLNCPGEGLDKVYNRLHDPKDYSGKRVMVVGGGDSAMESAIALAESGAQVLLSYRRKEFSRPKPENIEKLHSLSRGTSFVGAEKTPDKHASSGSIHLALGTTVQEIRHGEVVLLDEEKREKTFPNDVVFAMIGREAPLGFFRRSGLRIKGEGTIKGWAVFSVFLLCCFFMYTWKSNGFTENWLDPWPGNSAQLISSLGAWFASQVADRSTLLGTLAVSLKSRSFYYTLLYSLCVVIFGIQRIVRRRTPYVTAQTSVLVAVQIFPLFLLPEVFLPWLGYNGLFTDGFGRIFADNLFELYIPVSDYIAGNWPAWGHPRAYWRAYGFILAWPLMVYNVFNNSPLLWWIVISFFQTFIVIPALIYAFGKGAYCGWICSCGALAETMGDAQRSKMPHGPVWNRLNMTGQVILLVAVILLFIRICGWFWPDTWMSQSFLLILEGKNSQGQWVNPLSYKWVVDVLVGGIVGVSLYFKYSGRVWCRFACPLAALMHIYTRFSRFRIFADKKKCISCNACTSTCHQGIDIMNFANKGLPMEDPECVRCSACVQVCPTGVLTFGRYTRDGKIKYGLLAASPVQMREALKK